MSSARKKERVFRFKQFSVCHEKSGMKVGTDGVLLGAWADITEAKEILDIGTGTGLIALMLAQRSLNTVSIDAIEIDETAANEAKVNVQESPWSKKINVIHSAIQDFATNKYYDLIISNPPYFIDSYKPTEEKRETARHTYSLDFNDLLLSSQRLLGEKGKLNIILPVVEGEIFQKTAEQFNFYLHRQWVFKSRSHKPAERLLLEFSKTKIPGSIDTGEIVLHGDGEEWSETYKQLTKDFYLKI